MKHLLYWGVLIGRRHRKGCKLGSLGVHFLSRGPVELVACWLWQAHEGRSLPYVLLLAHACSTCWRSPCSESRQLMMLAVSSDRLQEARRSSIAYELQHNASNNCSASGHWSVTCQWVVSADRLRPLHAISQSISQRGRLSALTSNCNNSTSKSSWRTLHIAVEQSMAFVVFCHWYTTTRPT